jgi:flagella basal body P-ring formation protein FlgA
VLGKYLAKDVKKGDAIDGGSVVDRPPPSVRLASRDLVRGHPIAVDDLDKPSPPTMVGKYLTRDVKKGDVIEAKVVTDKRPAQTAKRDLARNHQVVADDLDPPDASALIGKYLVKDVKKGDVVDATAISDKAPVVKPNSGASRHRKSRPRHSSRHPH